MTYTFINFIFYTESQARKALADLGTYLDKHSDLTVLRVSDLYSLMGYGNLVSHGDFIHGWDMTSLQSLNIIQENDIYLIDFPEARRITFSEIGRLTVDSTETQTDPDKLQFFNKFHFKSDPSAKQFIKDLERLLVLRDLAYRYALGADAEPNPPHKHFYGYFTYCDILLMLSCEPDELYHIDPRMTTLYWKLPQWEEIKIDKTLQDGTCFVYLPKPANLSMDEAFVRPYSHNKDDEKIKKIIEQKVIYEASFYKNFDDDRSDNSKESQ